MEKSPVYEPAADSSHNLEVAHSRDYYVVQHNDLVQKQRFSLERNAGSSLTMLEEKVIAYLISQIKPGQEALQPITFDIKAFCEITGLAPGGETHNYTWIKGILNKLAGRVLWLYDRKEETETTVRYIDKAKLFKRSGRVEIRLDQDLGPYLLNLAGNYFQFSYHNILAMKSKYGIQLYKLLKSYVYSYPRIKFSLDDLKEHLDAASYANFANFKKKVLGPALRDINTYSDLDVTAEYEKTGRAFTHVIFTMKSLEQPRTLEEKEEKQRRYINAEREINPDQLIIDEYLGGILL